MQLRHGEQVGVGAALVLVFQLAVDGDDVLQQQDRHHQQLIAQTYRNGAQHHQQDVDCRYCLHYRRRSCQVRTCPYIAERLKSGAIEYLDLILEYFGHIPHAGLHKRIQAVEHWSGPDQAVLHTVSVHLRSRFADRVWDDAPPGYLAALYLLASKERLWQPALPALSHDSIDFSRIVSKPHGFAIQDYPIFYSARRLYDLKSPMEAEDLAHPKLVSDLDFHNIIYATMIARYGKAVMDASKEAPEWAMC